MNHPHNFPRAPQPNLSGADAVEHSKRVEKRVADLEGLIKRDGEPLPEIDARVKARIDRSVELEQTFTTLVQRARDLVEQLEAKLAAKGG